MDTKERLGAYAALLNKCGIDSKEAREFLDQHRFDSEFAELAEIERKLKESIDAKGPCLFRRLKVGDRLDLESCVGEITKERGDEVYIESEEFCGWATKKEIMEAISTGSE